MSRDSLTTEKLAQVLTDGDDCGFKRPNRFVDALQAIQAFGRVQRMFYPAWLVHCRPDSHKTKIAILLTNQVQCGRGIRRRDKYGI